MAAVSSIFFFDALVAGIETDDAKTAETRALEDAIERGLAAEDGEGDAAGIETYHLLINQMDSWMAGDKRGEIGPHELALVPIARYFIKLREPRFVPMAITPALATGQITTLKALYSDLPFVESLVRPDAPIAVGRRIYPLIVSDALVPANLDEPLRYELYTLAVHFITWTQAVTHILRESAIPPLSPGIPLSDGGGGGAHMDVELQPPPPTQQPKINIRIQDVLRSATGALRICAQTLFVATGIPACAEPLHRRRTGSQTVEIWSIANTSGVASRQMEQLAYCKNRYNGTAWSTGEEGNDDEDDEDEDGMAFVDAGDVMSGVDAVLPIARVVQIRERRRREAMKQVHVEPPTAEMKRACEDAWYLAAWGLAIDQQLAKGGRPVPPTGDPVTFQQCLVQAHSIGSRDAKAKFAGTAYLDVRRLPAIVIVAPLLYVVRCGACARATVCRSAPVAVEKWAECVVRCHGSRDGFGIKLDV